jgi:isopenicillin N synthase-like dioxygenase
MPDIPIVELDGGEVAERVGEACREHGFFYVVGHGVDPALLADLRDQSRAFFDLPVQRKLEIRMALGGRAWRGYFPVGAELTSGRPDAKEGLYFGAELGPQHPRVQAGVPLHGPNLFPAEPAGLRRTVLDYLDAMTALGHRLMAAIAQSLDLPADYFAQHYTANPLVLFRIFNYPAQGPDTSGWGVGEHTDYGLLTILNQDDSGGLQVRTAAGWVDAVPVPGSFVCNIGDMLDRLTGGYYRSTPHRVLPPRGRDRLSWPFFFDPDLDAQIKPIRPPSAHVGRWDALDLQELSGTYGDYLLDKIGKVFPDLHRDVLDDFPDGHNGRS